MHYLRQLPTSIVCDNCRQLRHRNTDKHYVRQLPTSIMCDNCQSFISQNCPQTLCDTTADKETTADKPSLQEAAAPRPQPGRPPARGLPIHETRRRSSIIRDNCRLAFCETTADNCETGTTDKNHLKQLPKSSAFKRPLHTGRNLGACGEGLPSNYKTELPTSII
jgi:hypothetical protein